MGMDVYGKNPTDEAGEYFRRSVWSWHPLWQLCGHFAADVTTRVLHGHTNDGDGLDDRSSVELADRLIAALETGGVRDYVNARNAVLEAEPDETCRWCQGTGTRRDAVGVSMGMADRGWCNGCRGKGAIRPFSTHYRVDEADVAEFVAFLRSCGGFEIL